MRGQYHVHRRGTDRQTDGQTRWTYMVKPTYHLNSFAGGIKTTTIEIGISMVVVISIVVPKML